MDIIYLSNSCSDEKFNALREKGITQKLPQAQKYHKLLMEGLVRNIDGELYSLSAFSVNRKWTKQIRFKREEEKVNGINYIYGNFLNLPVLRQLCRIVETKREIKKIHKKGSSQVIICDVLTHSLAKAARACGKKYGIPVIGIVTDVPGHTSGARRKTLSLVRRIVSDFASYIGEKNISKYDGYLLLTEAMNEIVNPKNKPYIMLEGHCDSKMESAENNLTAKSSPKVAMYAGGIHREFGIERLVNAFVKGNFTEWELHIYGDGNYQNDLTELAKNVPSVKYFGVHPNYEIVKKQLEASLLVNPRLTDAEYVKYSFPSKTMECMVSGTPLLTTKLPGMPDEYYPYVYLFDGETEDEMLETLDRVMHTDAESLHDFGARARLFVLAEKTNLSQAKKLVNFIQDVYKIK